MNSKGHYTTINGKTIFHCDSKDATNFREELKHCKVLFELYNDILKAILERIDCRNAKSKGSHERAVEDRKIDTLKCKLDALKKTIERSEIFKGRKQ